MKVTKELEIPTPPPIKHIIIEMSVQEARYLREYLDQTIKLIYYTYLDQTIKLIYYTSISPKSIVYQNITDLYEQLNKNLR